MKICVVQPKYSFDASEGEACFSRLLSLLCEVDASADVIVLPEYGDLPYDERDPAKFVSVAKANGEALDTAAREAAVRCGATVFYNRFDFTPTGMRNTTFAVDAHGDLVGKYVKEHPAPSEVRTVAEGGHGLDVSYSYSYRAPTVLEIGGVRYAFITCYDSYFYEYYSVLAKQNPDVIVCCSLQRTDGQDVLETFHKFMAYNTNAYVIRSSVSLGESSALSGCSMIVAPTGEVLCNMKSRVGIGEAQIDVKKKYEKPAGFGGAPLPHHAYVEEGRRTWLYRPAGPATVPSDRQMPYPRICAHRGFSAVLPENSMPAFGAAIALGAQEIEFDVWASADGELVSLHDSRVDRVSDGSGFVYDLSYEELSRLDFGAGTPLSGLHIVRFEDILKKYARQTVMNIHVKIWDEQRPEPYYRKIGDLIRRYDCADHVYMMTTSDEALVKFHELYPEIRRCKGYDGDTYVRRAVELGVDKVQLFKPYFDEETVRYAHENGLKCNVFFADEPQEAKKYLDMGIDCILTNNFLAVKNACEEKMKK